MVRLPFTFLAWIVLVCAAAQAGPKPDPAPLPPDSDPMEKFIKVYEKASHPRLLVICGRDTRSGASEPREAHVRLASGDASGGEHIGTRVQLFDATGDAEMLKTHIEGLLLKNRDVELVQTDALAEKDRRDTIQLQDVDPNAALELLARKVNADVVFMVRMQVVTGSLSTNRQYGYRVFLSVIDVPRGRKVGSFAFDWRSEAMTNEFIKRYASAVTGKFMQIFQESYQTNSAEDVRKYTVRMVGMSDATSVANLDAAIAKLPGVKKCISRGMYRQGASAMNELSLQYQGEHAELVSGIMKAAVQADAGLALAEATAGTIVLAKPTVTRSAETAKGAKIVINHFSFGRDAGDSMASLAYGLCLAEMTKHSEVAVINAAEFGEVMLRVGQGGRVSGDAALKKAMESCGAGTIVVGKVEKTSKGYQITIETMDTSLKVVRSESMAISSQDELDAAMKLLVKIILIASK